MQSGVAVAVQGVWVGSKRVVENGSAVLEVRAEGCRVGEGVAWRWDEVAALRVEVATAGSRRATTMTVQLACEPLKVAIKGQRARGWIVAVRMDNLHASQVLATLERMEATVALLEDSPVLPGSIRPGGALSLMGYDGVWLRKAVNAWNRVFSTLLMVSFCVQMARWIPIVVPMWLEPWLGGIASAAKAHAVTFYAEHPWMALGCSAACLLFAFPILPPLAVIAVMWWVAQQTLAVVFVVSVLQQGTVIIRDVARVRSTIRSLTRLGKATKSAVRRVRPKRD